jgi:hypothetical protein
MATASLERTTATAPTLTTKATISYWCKRGKMSGWNNGAIAGGHDSGNTANNNWQCGFIDTDKFYLWNNGTSMNLVSTRRARDTNAWYHVVWSLDSTQSTAADRAKLYVNGVQETVFDTADYPTQNGNFDIFRNGNAFRVGKYINTSGSDYWYDGCLSHVHFVDGTTYQASTFGQTDATTGEWSINANPTVNYGNNGVFILKNDNSNLDRSGNGLNFTMGGTVTKTEDNPSNVFNVNNPLIVQSANGNHANGNTNWSTGAASWRMTIGSIGATTGKYYAECQVYGSGGNVHWMNGIVSLDQNMAHSNQYPGGDSGKLGAAYNWDGQQYVNGSNSNYGASYGNNDIIGIAMDLDNRKLYFSKNGTWQNSGVPTSGSTGTGAINIPSSTDAYTFGFSAHNSSMSCNFGNGYFGTTAVSSAGTNASNLGIFEYDVPSGYTALCTKGLNL